MFLPFLPLPLSLISAQNDESHSDIASFKGGRSSRRAKERHQMSDEERLQTDMTDMRCLTLCIGMLERVHGVGATCFIRVKGILTYAYLGIDRLLRTTLH